MDYFLPSLTVGQVTNLYLYGQPDMPSDLIDETLVRAPEIAQNQLGMTIVHLDAVSFMSTGPGRYATATMSALVNDFMQGGIMPATGVRQEVDLSYFVGLEGEARRSLSYQQYDYGAASSDFASRVYIFNSSAYAIANGAKFVGGKWGQTRLFTNTWK